MLTMPGTFARRLLHLLRSRQAEREMDEEMRFHLELEVADRMRRGVPPDEARRGALLDFGGVERHKEEGRSARGIRPLQDVMRDVGYAARSLSKSPGLTLVAVLTVAIGMTATTTVFSLVNAVLFRPPPVAGPGRLFTVAEVWEGGGRSTSTSMAQHMYSYTHYLAVRRATTSVFSAMAGYRHGTVAMRVGDEARPTSSIASTPNYFSVLGLQPALGRFFADTSERGPVEPEAVISHDLWMSRFGGDSSVLGSAMFLNGRPMTLVGVAPRGFRGTMTGLATDIWLVATSGTRESARRGGAVIMLGRLRTGMTPEQALTALDVIAPNVAGDQPWQRIRQFTLDPIIGPPAMSRAVVSGFMVMLFASAALVLAIAAANIAGMLLARGAYRRREIAIRLALGAGRGRIIRQLVTESVALCFLGGVAGLLLARWTVGAIPVIQPPIGVRILLELSIDGPVLLLSFALALLAGVLAGLTPALQATRLDVLAGLRGIDGGEPRRHGRTRGAFVVAQVAMSIVLLTIAGLFTRATQRALDADLGLDTRNVAVAEIDLGPHGYQQDRGLEFQDRLMARLASRPEISSAGLGQWTPLSMSHTGQGINAPDGARVGVTYGIATPGYFETVGIVLRAGRAFRLQDDGRARPVVIVNETLARRFWPGESALGRVLPLEGEREVIGVVLDGKYRSLDEAPTAYAFLPVRQRYSSRITIHVRGRHDTGAALAAIRSEVIALDRNIALEDAGSLGEQLTIYTVPQRVAAWSIGVFGAIGLLLAALGIHGVTAYHVARRTRELGIRIALGARRSDVATSVLTQVVRLVTIGLLVGIPVSIGVAALARSFLFGVSAADPVTLAVVSALLAVVAVLASWAPTRRAQQVDPMISLKAE